MTYPSLSNGRVKFRIPDFLWSNPLPFFLLSQHHLFSIPPPPKNTYCSYPYIKASFYILLYLSTFLFNYNEKYPCNLLFCQTHLQNPDLTFWKISYLIYTHLGQCPLILFLCPCNSFFIICGEDNSLCSSSEIIVLKPSLKQK